MKRNRLTSVLPTRASAEHIGTSVKFQNQTYRICSIDKIYALVGGFWRQRQAIIWQTCEKLKPGWSGNGNVLNDPVHANAFGVHLSSRARFASSARSQGACRDSCTTTPWFTATCVQ